LNKKKEKLQSDHRNVKKKEIPHGKKKKKKKVMRGC